MKPLWYISACVFWSFSRPKITHKQGTPQPKVDSMAKITLTVFGQTHTIAEWAQIQARKLNRDPKKVEAAIRQRYNLNKRKTYKYADHELVLGIRQPPAELPSTILSEAAAKAIHQAIKPHLLRAIAAEVDKILGTVNKEKVKTKPETVYGQTYKQFRDEWIGTPGFEDDAEVERQWELLPKD